MDTLINTMQRNDENSRGRNPSKDQNHIYGHGVPLSEVKMSSDLSIFPKSLTGSVLTGVVKSRYL